MKQKRRPERLHPGLKQLTPDERKTIATEMNRVREMWKSLYARNKWKPQPDDKKVK